MARQAAMSSRLRSLLAPPIDNQGKNDNGRKPSKRAFGFSSCPSDGRRNGERNFEGTKLFAKSDSVNLIGAYPRGPLKYSLALVPAPVRRGPDNSRRHHGKEAQSTQAAALSPCQRPQGLDSEKPQRRPRPGRLAGHGPARFSRSFQQTTPWSRRKTSSKARSR